MESIMLNLLSNAIKYKHPDRIAEIQICTFIEDDRPCLLVKDNGMGIDLDKNGQKIFNIYQTFHYNKDAVGVGLFITKNQIESLGGTIEIKSEVDIGTTFIIKF
jgi:signal transduction histidine kinase